MTTHPIEILLVEDNPGDVRLTQIALQDARVCNHMQIASDGAQALAILRRDGAHATAPRPDLILLDLNLPLMSGQELLAIVKQDPTLRRIPVVILTTSQAEQDILSSYNLHANAYVNKPVDLEQFSAVVRAIEGFWFQIVRLPNGKEA